MCSSLRNRSAPAITGRAFRLDGSEAGVGLKLPFVDIPVVRAAAWRLRWGPAHSLIVDDDLEMSWEWGREGIYEQLNHSVGSERWIVDLYFGYDVNHACHFVSVGFAAWDIRGPVSDGKVPGAVEWYLCLVDDCGGSDEVPKRLPLPVSDRPSRGCRVEVGLLVALDDGDRPLVRDLADRPLQQRRLACARRLIMLRARMCRSASQCGSRSRGRRCAPGCRARSGPCVWLRRRGGPPQDADAHGPHRRRAGARHRPWCPTDHRNRTWCTSFTPPPPRPNRWRGPCRSSPRRPRCRTGTAG